MRLNKNQIEHMAFAIVRNLIKQEKIIVEKKTKLIEELENLIIEEFQKEDKLDQEVREILSQYMEKIRKENIEYQTMFRMIKTKLAKERDIVL
ncbi:MAG: DUF507 family protein [Candidatus Aminicenantes bacterium]|nr:MAG: DUF507 family protein [Candidatus Aminicenantes bacterium]